MDALAKEALTGEKVKITSTSVLADLITVKGVTLSEEELEAPDEELEDLAEFEGDEDAEGDDLSADFAELTAIPVMAGKPMTLDDLATLPALAPKPKAAPPPAPTPETKPEPKPKAKPATEEPPPFVWDTWAKLKEAAAAAKKEKKAKKKATGPAAGQTSIFDSIASEAAPAIVRQASLF